MWQQPQLGIRHPGACAGSASHSAGRSLGTLRSGPPSLGKMGHAHCPVHCPGWGGHLKGPSGF